MIHYDGREFYTKLLRTTHVVREDNAPVDISLSNSENAYSRASKRFACGDAPRLSKKFTSAQHMSPRSAEVETQKSLKRVTWQYENCLECVWFSPNDPINADLLERGNCVHPKLKAFNLIVSGRDWCNLYKEITQKQIDIVQERAMKSESEK